MRALVAAADQPGLAVLVRFGPGIRGGLGPKRPNFVGFWRLASVGTALGHANLPSSIVDISAGAAQAGLDRC
jgi:hypothetical protein